MFSLHIVTVSWNVSDLLEKGLRSLPAACEGLDWSCAVVDNASSDQSVAVAKRVASDLGSDRVMVIANAENLGFAKACNLGARERSDTEFVLFLNPDTESPPGSITKLVKRMMELPNAGILGPKLVYPDGTWQPSVRRFPSVSDQLFQVLKLSHAFPNSAIMQRYLAADFDPTREQSVEQVMGACFLMRRAVFDEIGGFDERFFIWMEEVDVCKQVKARGYDVVYSPVATVVHHLGRSFAKAFHPTKQKNYVTSLKKYFDKWHPGWQAWAVRFAAPIGLGLVWFVHFFQQPVGRIFAAIAIIEALSLGVSVFPMAELFCAIGFSLIVGLVTWKRPEWGLVMLLVERFVGSQGGLFRFVGSDAEPGTGLAVRIGIFVAFGLGWLVSLGHSERILQKREESTREALGRSLVALRSLYATRDDKMPWLALLALIAFALLRGLALGQTAFLFSDANAWFDLVLLIPILHLATTRSEQFQRLIPAALIASLSWLIVQTLGLEYLFSHFFGSGFVDQIYRWLRDARLAEITWAPGNVWRIFLQSQIYSAIAVVAGLAVIGSGRPSPLSGGMEGGRNFVSYRGSILLLAGSVAVVLLSLSRSLWLGTAVGSVVAFGCVLKGKRFPDLIRGLSTSALVVILGIIFAISANLVPLPPVSGSWRDALSARANMSESAASSRWALLPAMIEKIKESPILGSGFGSIVTYQSQDPRVVASTGGTYTTFAFEWGWLGLWIKFGILGPLVMLWLLGSIVTRFWKTIPDLIFRSIAIGAIVTLTVTHVFTPYLDHPLGFTVLYLLEGWIASEKRMLS